MSPQGISALSEVPTTPEMNLLNERRGRMKDLLNDPWYTFAAIYFLFQQNSIKDFFGELKRIEMETSNIQSEEGSKKFDFEKFKGTLNALFSMLKYILGQSWSEFKTSQETESSFGTSQIEKEKIRQRLYEQLDFLKNVEDPDEAMDDLAEEVNQIIEGDVEQFFVGSDIMQMTEEVKEENDIIELLYLAKHPRAAKDVPFEAFRKILFILFVGKKKSATQNKYNSEPESKTRSRPRYQDNKRANSNMLRFINDHFADPDHELAKTQKEYLVFSFTDETKTTVKDAHISSQKPSENKGKESIFSVPIPKRHILLEDENGTTYKTQMYLSARKKGKKSSVHKQIRFAREIDEKGDDQNGFHFVFKNNKDARNFHRMLRRKIPEQIRLKINQRIGYLENRIQFLKQRNDKMEGDIRTLFGSGLLGKRANEELIQEHELEIEAHKSRLKKLDEDKWKPIDEFIQEGGSSYITSAFRETQIKDSLDGGNGEGSKTSSKTRSQPKQWLKGKWEINGTQQDWLFEFKILNPLGFANLEYGAGESPGEHHIQRFNSPANFPESQPFDLEYGSASLLYPDSIYPDAKKDRLKQIALENASKAARSRLTELLPQSSN